MTGSSTREIISTSCISDYWNHVEVNIVVLSVFLDNKQEIKRGLLPRTRCELSSDTDWYHGTSLKDICRMNPVRRASKISSVISLCLQGSESLPS